MSESPASKLNRAEILVRSVCATLDCSKEPCCVTCGVVKNKNWVEAKLYKKLVACADKLEDAGRQLALEAET